MMNKLLTGIIATSGLVLAVGCSDTFDPHSDGRAGRILPSIDLDTQVQAPAKAAKAASRAGAEVSVTDLALRLTSADGSMVSTWGSVADFPASEEYPVGDYTLEAFYGTAGEEGFEKPYYYGSQNLSVLENKVTPVNLTAQLANSIVTIQYTEAVKQYFTSCSANVHSAGGDYIPVASDETRLLYVNPGKIDINVDVVRPTGAAASLNPFSFTAEARHHYYVTFDINSGAGTAFLTVTFDSSVETEEVEINVSDQILVAPAPTVALTGAEAGLEIIEGTTPETPVRADIIAQGGLKSAVLTTNSPALLSIGWPAEVDFDTADAATLATLKNMGLQFPGLEGVKSETGRIDFTNLLKNIPYIAGADNTTTFTVVAKDNLTKVSEPVSFSVTVNKIELELGDVEPLYLEETELTLNVDYNGADIANDVTFQHLNELGVWKPLTVKEAVAATRANTTYRVTLIVPADGDLRIKAVCGSVTTPEIEVKRTEPTHTVEVNANNVFATKGTGLLTMLDGSNAATALASAKLYISEDNEKYTELSKNVSGANFSMAGLKPATTYYVKASVDGKMSRPVNFTTEAATQLPYASFDESDWTITDSKSNWELYVIGASDAATVWGTNNPMTTSQGHNFAADYAYDAVSGTKPVDGYIGKGACISTQGWGSGNSALIGVQGACKYIDAGLLHLGASRAVRPDGYSGRTGCLSTDDLDCGYAFSSRPDAVSFWYKYDRKHSSDRGVATVVVYDASGAVIAENKVEMDSQSSYAPVSVPLTYVSGAAKAAKIYVCFTSTNSESTLVKESAYLNGPGFGNTSRGEYSGSRLYVDEITLDY